MFQIPFAFTFMAPVALEDILERVVREAHQPDPMGEFEYVDSTMALERAEQALFDGERLSTCDRCGDEFLPEDGIEPSDCPGCRAARQSDANPFDVYPDF